MAVLAVAATTAGCATGGNGDAGVAFSAPRSRSSSAFGSGAGLASKTPDLSTRSAGGLGDQPEKNPLEKLASTISESKVGKSTKAAFASNRSSSASAAATPAFQASSNNPSPDFHVAVARMQESQGNVDAARSQYERALELAPNHLAAQLGLARHYDRLGQLNEAARRYSEATAAHPSEPTVFNDLGLCYARQRRLPEAIEALNKAVKLAPEKVLYRNNLATVLIEAGAETEAYDHLVQVHGAAAAHYNVATLLNKQQQYQRALHHFRAAVDLDPTMSSARQWSDTLAAKISSGAITQASGGFSAGGSVVHGAGGGIYVAPSSNVGAGPALGQPVEVIPLGRPEAAPPPASLGYPPQSGWSPASNGAGGASLVSHGATETAPVPPTPDEAPNYVGASTADSAYNAAFQPLPPVDPATYPPSRY